LGLNKQETSMSKLVIGLAAASALAFGGAALAQSTPPATPAPSAPPPAATSPAMPVNPSPTPGAMPGTTPPAASTMPAEPPAQPAPGAGLTVGMQLKDNAGVAVGQISDLKPDASGAQMATIKMGADSFTVAAAALVVQNGAAVINMTQAQLQAQVHKPG
jgi:hypothetical protein